MYRALLGLLVALCSVAGCGKHLGSADVDDVGLRAEAALMQGDHDQAIELFNAVIRAKPHDLKVRMKRALAYQLKGDFAKAIEDYNEIIYRRPGDVFALARRGMARAENGDARGGVQDLNMAIDMVGGADGELLSTRASVHHKANQCRESYEDYQESLRLSPGNVMATNGMAWLLATCKDDKVRNGRKALEHAIEACELSDWKDAAIIDTLAAAYAEIGEFERAAKWQRKALETEGFAAFHLQGARERLSLYEQRMAYRE